MARKKAVFYWESIAGTGICSCGFLRAAGDSASAYCRSIGKPIEASAYIFHSLPAVRPTAGP